MMDAADDKGPGYSAPEANGYEFQSGGIVEMLKKLHDEFREKLATCQKDIEEKTAEKERKTEKTAESKKQLAATIDMKAENEKTLSDMETECAEKKMSFAEKQQLRAEEIEAIGKAMEILKSGDVSGNAEKYLNLAQTNQAKALLQVVGASKAASGETMDSPR